MGKSKNIFKHDPVYFNFMSYGGYGGLLDPVHLNRIRIGVSQKDLDPQYCFNNAFMNFEFCHKIQISD